jgi:hypothetical protein
MASTMALFPAPFFSDEYVEAFGEFYLERRTEVLIALDA